MRDGLGRWPEAIPLAAATTFALGACQVLAGIGNIGLTSAESGADSGGRTDTGSGRADGAGARPDARASDVGPDHVAPVCTPSTQRCVAGPPPGSIESCSSLGQWGAATVCATGTCAGNSCTGSTMGTTNPSCQGATAAMECGPSMESCCTSLEVPGGTYFRTYDPNGPDGGPMLMADGGATGKADPASISGFQLDKYEVTVARFRQFVKAWNGGDGGAGAYRPGAGSGKHVHLNGGQGLVALGADGGQAHEPGWVTADDANVMPSDANLTPVAPYTAYVTWEPSMGNDTLPMTSMNWYEAYAFCIYDGGFLPSEAEWEYAAAGGARQLEYPWGATAPGLGSQFAIYGCDYGGTGNCTGVQNIAPVGMTPLGVAIWGQFDLGGNVWEWALDWFAQDYDNPCVDCANLSPGTDRLIRGGDFVDPSDLMLARYRRTFVPTNRHFNIGFRCARTP